MQAPEVVASAPAFDTGSVVASQTESSPGPLVEPSPIPDSVVTASKQAEGSKAESSAAESPPATTESPSEPVVAEQSPTSAPAEPAAVAANSPAAEAPAAISETASSTGTAAAGTSPAQAAIASSAPAAASQQQPASSETQPSGATALATAATKGGPAAIRQPAVVAAMSRKTWLVGGLLLVGIFLLAWVIVPELRRRAFSVPGFLRAGSVPAMRTLKPRMAAEKGLAPGNGFFGGPRQISLRLTPSKPTLRRSALPSAKSHGPSDRLASVEAKVAPAPVYYAAEPTRESPPLTEALFESVGPVLEQSTATVPVSAEAKAVPAPVYYAAEPIPESPPLSESLFESVGPVLEQPTATVPVSAEAKAAPAPAYSTAEPTQESPSLTESLFESVGPVLEQPTALPPAAIPVPPEAAEISSTASEISAPSVTTEEEPKEILRAEEVVPQEQPASYEPPMAETQFPVAEPVSEAAFVFPTAISTEHVFPQTTTPITMPETTEIPTAPVPKPPPSVAAKPQPTASTQTSVQLTFTCEIAAMQLTPTFKMGVLKVRPTSKLVTMRLAPSQQPQPMNLQVGFEIARIQPAGEALGTIRMVPSQQQRPTAGGSPSFAVAGLQLVPDSGAAPLQLTTTQQGQAAVFVTAPFQITTLEFSPTLEIAAVILSSTSTHVVVQLPGASPSPGESAPMFEIANLQLGSSGELAMMQLNLLGQGPMQV
jgi:hypothetical protein